MTATIVGRGWVAALLNLRQKKRAVALDMNLLVQSHVEDWKKLSLHLCLSNSIFMYKLGDIHIILISSDDVNDGTVAPLS
jgi:hypothetical protein